ncbi:hypothetical protein [Streptomyces eurocidicus]|uniref:Ankyrin n=1 Tax=Streptomyces eurocidicus TaxID=66423 RepID=A0A7W8BCD8_STREU|nr:hypothetical protein [Streptomyces eurocidicus]MBB5119278.1 hypothetical protein [Streptomyces eurocidicus]MBF6053137.1 hypothetical protein [Streptomyces eurocidicus]
MIPSTTAPPPAPAPAFAGDFEAHLTVRPAATAEDDRALQRYAAAHGMKFTDILLDRGRTPSQPMLTLRASGPLPEVRQAVDAAARRLAGAGFAVVRTKIEAAPWAAGVPETDAEAAALGARYYFEHHLKLLLTPDTDLAALAGLTAAHRAHLSRNARRVRADGRVERFVTQRCRTVGRRTAGARLAALVAAVRAGGHTLVSEEREFVVHDSDETLDAGWIDEDHGTGRTGETYGAGRTGEDEEGTGA